MIETNKEKQRVACLKVLNKTLIHFEKNWEYLSGICDSINTISDSTHKEQLAGIVLKDWIGVQLEPHLFLGEWLYKNSPEFKSIYDSGINTKTSIEKMKETRIAWLKWMIKQYEQ